MNIVQLLRKKGLTLAVAESFTGGGFSNFITNIPHASEVFMGGIVSYSPLVKEKILQVPTKIIEKFGTVSEECARKMAINCRLLMHSDLALSFTGNAGPSSIEGKAVGLVYIGLATDKQVEVERLELKGTRQQIKKQAIQIALKKLENYLGTLS
ncbi:CinA family protein [bacterium]|jgi:PncC family amidohydrolase|nr:CinA family protein [bacterium]